MPSNNQLVLEDEREMNCDVGTDDEFFPKDILWNSLNISKFQLIFWIRSHLIIFINQQIRIEFKQAYFLSIKVQTLPPVPTTRTDINFEGSFRSYSYMQKTPTSTWYSDSLLNTTVIYAMHCTQHHQCFTHSFPIHYRLRTTTMEPGSTTIKLAQFIAIQKIYTILDWMFLHKFQLRPSSTNFHQGEKGIFSIPNFTANAQWEQTKL